MSAIFIFRRDFRIFDNTGIRAMLYNEKIEKVHFCFIFNPDQLKSGYASQNAIRFMVESLEELGNELKEYKFGLHLYYGDDKTILQSFKPAPDFVFFNEDITPFAKKRDNRLKKHFKVNTDFSESDYTLAPVGCVEKLYVKYTPYKLKFYEYIKENPVPEPKQVSSTIQKKSEYRLEVPAKYKTDFKKAHTFYKNPGLSETPAFIGGRSEALKKLKLLPKEQSRYDKTRNNLELNTTNLSAYTKFGCISIREFWHAISGLSSEAKQNLHDQLVWREFYYNICTFFPEMLNSQNSGTRTSINKDIKPVSIKWAKDQKEKYKIWKTGKTGIDIVDAGMNQLNKTGFMHNRARLLTANYAVKVLKIDWRICEKYFAKKLIDYDPIVNNGNWQWIASALDYLDRNFNFDRQAKLHDKNRKYRDMYLK